MAVTSELSDFPGKFFTGFNVAEMEVALMTTRTLTSLMTVLLLVGSVAGAGESVNGLPLHVEQLSDNAIRLWVGDYVSSTAVAALDTEKGIVVIDATESPILDKKFREVIAPEIRPGRLCLPHQYPRTRRSHDR